MAIKVIVELQAKPGQRAELKSLIETRRSRRQVVTQEREILPDI